MISTNQSKASMDLEQWEWTPLVGSAVFVCRMMARYLNCMILMSVLLTTTTQGYFIYPGLPLVSPGYPWLGSFLPSRTVINFSTEDCSAGDSLQPAPGTNCWQYYVCAAGRVRYEWRRKERKWEQLDPPITLHPIQLKGSLSFNFPRQKSFLDVFVEFMAKEIKCGEISERYFQKSFLLPPQ